jgi:hypothetical protein
VGLGDVGKSKSAKARHIEARIAGARTPDELVSALYEAHVAMIDREFSAGDAAIITAGGDKRVRELLRPLRRGKK